MSRELIASSLRGLRYAPTGEKELQDWIDGAFTRVGFLFEREVETGAGPVDFVIGTIAIEVKIKGSPVAITRQLLRYLQTGRKFTAPLVSLAQSWKSPAKLTCCSCASGSSRS